MNARQGADRHETPSHEAPCPDGLMCAIALDPDSLPRNRYYWVYEAPRARRAHGLAHSLRRLHGQLLTIVRRGASTMTLAREGRGIRIMYRDEALALTRRVHLSPIETSVLRLLLRRDDMTLPHLLRATDQDRLRVAAALGKLRSSPGLPVPSGWNDVLASLAPAGAPSNTTE